MIDRMLLLLLVVSLVHASPTSLSIYPSIDSLSHSLTRLDDCINRIDLIVAYHYLALSPSHNACDRDPSDININHHNRWRYLLRLRHNNGLAIFTIIYVCSRCCCCCSRGRGV